MNQVVLIGRVAKDIELRYLPNGGTVIATFSLAVDKGLSKDKKREMEAQGKYTCDFINIKVWGKMGENCANFLAKGRLVAIQGSIQTGSYNANDGSKRHTFDVRANNVEFLEWGDKGGNNGNSNSGNGTSNNSSSDFTGNGFDPVNEEDIPF